MATTIKDKLITALKASGYQEVTSRSRKYVVFIDAKNPSKQLYVGKAGALRRGENIEKSVPADVTKAALLRRYDELTATPSK
jgi:hypothetical protein